MWHVDTGVYVCACAQPRSLQGPELLVDYQLYDYSLDMVRVCMRSDLARTRVCVAVHVWTCVGTSTRRGLFSRLLLPRWALGGARQQPLGSTHPTLLS
jgi:hypothetical protein